MHPDLLTEIPATPPAEPRISSVFWVRLTLAIPTWVVGLWLCASYFSPETYLSMLPLLATCTLLGCWISW